MWVQNGSQLAVVVWLSDWCFLPCLRIPICLFNWFLLVYCLILARSSSFIRYLSLLCCFLFVCYKYCLPELKYTYYTYFVSFTCFIFVCIDFVSFLLVSAAVVLMEFLTFACRYLYGIYCFSSFFFQWHFKFSILMWLSMLLYHSNQFQSQEPYLCVLRINYLGKKTRSNAHCEWRKNAFHHYLHQLLLLL